MKSILGFKNLEMDDEDNRPCGENLITQLTEMHQSLMEKVSLEGLQGDEGGEVRKMFSLKITSIFILIFLHKTFSGRSRNWRKAWTNYKSQYLNYAHKRINELICNTFSLRCRSLEC